MEKIDLTYEEAVKELEEILEELEGETLSLNDSLDKFKKGITLYNYCNNMLNKVEEEVKVLLKDENNNLNEEDFKMEV